MQPPPATAASRGAPTTAEGPAAPHTPGPWHTDPSTGHESVWARGNQFVADCCIFGRLRTQATNQANARLIAAAPDLLAALKAVLPLISDTIQTHPDAAGYSRVQAARAAIAKAEGCA